MCYEKIMAFFVVGGVCGGFEWVLYCAACPWDECGDSKSATLILKGNLK